MNDRMPAGRPSNQDGEFSGRRCPVIVGPTAVGKTELITRLAAEHHIEVISLDSRQIYRGLRIGTAQPTQAELGICPHHLIDFVSPAEKYDAMRFRDDFEIAFAGICGRGGVPILVGGAGMYLTALQEGFLEIPGNNGGRLAAVRADLDRLSDAEILTRLTAVDPISAGRLHPNDRYRLQRALEIHQLSGRSMTELTAEQRPVPALGLRFPTFVLERPTPELDKRIAQRTEIMVSSGWIEETEAALGKHSADCPGLRSIGYREIVAMLKGELNLGEVPSAIVRVTRQYAKRQRTWFRKLDCLERGNPQDEALSSCISAAVESGQTR